MPRKGYKSVGYNSLPDDYIKAMDKLKKDPKFIAEMRRKGHTRISRALILRIAINELLERKGITRISEVEGK